MTAEEQAGKKGCKRDEIEEEKGTDEHIGAQTGTRPARDLSGIEWALLQNLIAHEGLSYAAAGRRFNVKASSVRMRATRERWHDPRRVAGARSIEDTITQCNDAQLLRALAAMDGRLDEALRATDADALALALKKAELVGKHLRGAQNIARAISISARTKAQLRTTPAAPSKPAFDRKELERKLLSMVEKMEAAERQTEPDGDEPE